MPFQCIVSWPSSKLGPQVPPCTVYREPSWKSGLYLWFPNANPSFTRITQEADSQARHPEILIQWGSVGHGNLCCVSSHGNSIVQPWLEPQPSPFPSLAVVTGLPLSPPSWCYYFKCLHNHLPGKKSSGPFKILGSSDFSETCDTDDNWQCSPSLYTLLPLFQGHQCWWFLTAPLSSFIFLLLFKNWSIVDLQCCVSFRCRVKWFSRPYISIYSFSGSFPL